MRLKVIACDSLRHEICAVAARSRARTELEFLRPNQGDEPSRLTALQAVVDRAEQTGQFDGIALACGLCGSGLGGLASHTVPIAIPRMQNCVGFPAAEGGICLRSTGWAETRGRSRKKPAVRVVRGKQGAAPASAYHQVTYITTAPPRVEFLEVSGGLPLFERLLNGLWTGNDILVVPPGWRVRPTADGRGFDRERIR